MVLDNGGLLGLGGSSHAVRIESATGEGVHAPLLTFVTRYMAPHGHASGHC